MMQTSLILIFIASSLTCADRQALTKWREKGQKPWNHQVFLRNNGKSEYGEEDETLGSYFMKDVLSLGIFRMKNSLSSTSGRHDMSGLYIPSRRRSTMLLEEDIKANTYLKGGLKDLPSRTAVYRKTRSLESTEEEYSQESSSSESSSSESSESKSHLLLINKVYSSPPFRHNLHSEDCCLPTFSSLGAEVISDRRCICRRLNHHNRQSVANNRREYDAQSDVIWRLHNRVISRVQNPSNPTPQQTSTAALGDIYPITSQTSYPGLQGMTSQSPQLSSANTPTPSQVSSTTVQDTATHHTRANLQPFQLTFPSSSQIKFPSIQTPMTLSSNLYAKESEQGFPQSHNNPSNPEIKTTTEFINIFAHTQVTSPTSQSPTLSPYQIHFPSVETTLTPDPFLLNSEMDSQTIASELSQIDHPVDPSSESTPPQINFPGSSGFSSKSPLTSLSTPHEISPKLESNILPSSGTSSLIPPTVSQSTISPTKSSAEGTPFHLQSSTPSSENRQNISFPMIQGVFPNTTFANHSDTNILKPVAFDHGTGLIGIRVSARAPLLKCHGECEFRNTLTGFCSIDYLCKANMTEIL